VLEVNCETDFVARNDMFQGMVLRLARAAMGVPSPAAPQQQHTLELELDKVGWLGSRPDSPTRT